MTKLNDIKEEALVEVRVLRTCFHDGGMRMRGDILHVVESLADKTLNWARAHEVPPDEPVSKVQEPTTLSELAASEQKNTKAKNWKQ